MGKHRIYGESVSIQMENVQKFYDKRASLVEERGWGAISLGDEDSTIANRVYDYDRDTLFPIAIQEIIKEYQRQKTNQRSRKGGSARKPQQYHAEAEVII